MAQYRDHLPQLAGDLFLTDGGIETTLIYHDGLDLPCFASFVLLRDDGGVAALRRYFRTYAALAREYGVGCILESPTWRANPDWGGKLGYAAEELAAANRAAIALLGEVRGAYEAPGSPMVISGCIGPRGDGYVPSAVMSPDAAERYHRAQIDALARTEADMVTAITMNYADEAIGIVRAARTAGMPVAISFTVETDGRLPTGQPLRQAIERTDEATRGGPAYYMVNCAHPSHFAGVLEEGEAWTGRIRGVRANASTKSHAELDASEELDEGDPLAFGREHRELRDRLPGLTVLGGCCGTDHRHIEAICRACVAPA